MKVAILKYNAGNICSVVNALERIGCNPILTDSAEELQSADKVVFPGQGAAGPTMKYLKEHGLDSLVRGLQQPNCFADILRRMIPTVWAYSQ